MVKSIKAIFFDIDGTLIPLFDPESKIVPSTLEALYQLREKGIKLFISSGRPYDFIKNQIGKQFEFDGYVAANGQYCIIGDKVLRDIKLDMTHFLDAIDYADKHQLTIAIPTHKGNVVNFISDRARQLFRDPIKCIPQDLKTYVDKELYFMMLFVDEKEEKPFFEVMPEVKGTRWNELYCDVIPKDGGKDKGIQTVIDELGISVKETMCFGDGGNDIPMLDFCGLSVVMGNAKDDVKVHGDYVTDDVKEDGIYKALKHFNIL